MSAQALILRVTGDGAELCPHADAREQAAIALLGRRPMIVCRRCFDVFGELIAAWHAYSIRPATVYRKMRELGYDQADAVRFLVQLIANRAQVRLGLLKRSQVDV